MNLYEISNQYQYLLQSEEFSADELVALDAIHDSMEEKAKSIGAVIKTMEAEENAIVVATKAMEERASSLSHKISNLKDYLKQNLELCHIKEVKSPWFDIKIMQNPPSVVLLDDQQVPSDYREIRESEYINRKAIAEALKSGIAVPGAILVRNTRLAIR